MKHPSEYECGGRQEEMLELLIEEEEYERKNETVEQCMQDGSKSH